MKKRFIALSCSLATISILSAAPIFIDKPVTIEYKEPEHLILIPEPQKHVVRNGAFIYPEQFAIEAQGKEATEIAALLAEELREYCGLDVTAGKKGPVKLSIDPMINNGRPESYTLRSTDKEIIITGRDKRGLFYGTMTLLQMSRKSIADAKIRVQSAEIADWPDLPNRGYFFELNANNVYGGQSSFDWLKRCIRRFSAYYKSNMVGLGEAGAGCFPLKKYPFIQWKRGLSAAQICELVALARKYQLEPYPVIEILGHAEGLFLKHEPGATGDLKHNALNGKAFDFVELNEHGKRGNSVCTLHPDTKNVVTDVFDTVVELFDNPQYVHIGMDEVFPFGKCVRCRNHDAAELFADYLNWCYKELKSRGVKHILLWNEMLLNYEQFGIGASNRKKTIAFMDTKATFNAVTHPAIDKIPKDLELVSSDYRMRKPEVIDYLRSKGFPVWAASWKGEKEPYLVARTCIEKNLSGFIGTTWTFSYWRSSTAPAAADAAWAPHKNIRNFNRLERLWLDMLPPRPSEFYGTTSSAITLTGNVKRTAVFAAAKVDQRPDRTGGFVKGKLQIGKVNYEINDQVFAVAGADFSKTLAIPGSISMPINRKAVGLAFLQAGFNYPILRTNTIGSMTVQYNDGTTVSAPIRNAQNIDTIQFHDAIDPEAKIGTRRATDARLFELRSPWNWNLKLYSWEWLNPHPEKTIKLITWDIDKSCKKEAFAIFGISCIEKK